MYFSDDNVFQSGSAENSPEFVKPNRKAVSNSFSHVTDYSKTGVRKSSTKSGTSRRETGALDTPDSEMPPPTPFRSTKPQSDESRRKSYMPPISDLRTSQSF